MLSTVLATIALPWGHLAQAGGGGSGGGGGDDGGGIFVLLGYLPMHFVGALLRRFIDKYPLLLIPLNIVGWVTAVAYSVMWVFIWDTLGFFIGLAALGGMAAGLYKLFSKFKQSKRVQEGLAAAQQGDSNWSEEQLVEHARKVFTQYQADWSARNSVAMQKYMTPGYYRHASLLVAVMAALKRKNIVDEPKVLDVGVIDMHDDSHDDHDWFTVGFTASANDQLIDEERNETLFTNNKPFTEYWTFQRSGKTWLLGGISQQTADPLALNGQLRDLAQQNGYYYSLDMGWLFIPRRGQLFGGAKFGISDINNHIVGMYQDKLLVQLYTYSKVQGSTPYVIAQVNVPQHYGNIVVRRKKMLRGGIRDLEKVETEWPDFNKKYDVYASAPDQVTSFELLNPTYMEQLEALPFEVNIEVVDNIIYLYAPEAGTSLEVYQGMLEIVQKAFKELRL